MRDLSVPVYRSAEAHLIRPLISVELGRVRSNLFQGTNLENAKKNCVVCQYIANLIPLRSRSRRREAGCGKVCRIDEWLRS